MADSTLILPHANAYAALTKCIRSTSSLALAFSGGLDSRFLAFTAARVGVPMLLVHAAGPHVMESESLAAHAWAKKYNFPFLRVQVMPHESEEVRSSGTQRCYHCKKLLFSAILDAISLDRANGPYTLCDGTNADDLEVFRPGLRALQELDIVSPLALSGIGKRHIREMGRCLGFDNPQQTARPCLLTRFPYNAHVSREQLTALGNAEELLQKFLEDQARATGHTAPVNFRLRCETEDNPGMFSQAAPDPPTQAGPLLTTYLHTDLPLSENAVRMAAELVSPCDVFLVGVQLMQRVSGYFDTPRAHNLE